MWFIMVKFVEYVVFHGAVNLIRGLLWCHLYLPVERGQVSLVRLGPLWWHRPIWYVS